MTLWRHHLRLNQIGGSSKSLPGGQLTELKGNNKGEGRGAGLGFSLFLCLAAAVVWNLCRMSRKVVQSA